MFRKSLFALMFGVVFSSFSGLSYSHAESLVKSLEGSFSIKQGGKEAVMNYQLDVYGNGQTKPEYAIFSSSIVSSTFGSTLKPDTNLRLESMAVRCPCFVFQHRDVTITFKSFEGLNAIEKIQYGGLEAKLSSKEEAPSDLIEGKVLGVVRCLCDASMSVEFGGRQGYIANDQKVSEVTLSLGAGDETITIRNPSKGVRSYYVVHQVSEDSQLSEALRAKGIDPSSVESASLESFKAPPGTPLYKDPKMMGAL